MEETVRYELIREIEVLKKKLMNPRLDYKVTIAALENSESFPRIEVCNGYNEMDDALQLAYTKLNTMKRSGIQGDWRVVLTVTSYDTIRQTTFGLVNPKVEYEKEIGFGDLNRCQFNVFLTLDENARDEMLNTVTDRKNTLTMEEVFVLGKIATRLGMDTWFMVSEDRKAIVDLENNENRLSLHQGICEMIEECYNVQEEGQFSLYEMDIFENILDRFNVSKNGLNLEREHECLTYLKHHDKNFQKLHSMFPILGYKEADIAGFQVIMGDINDEEQQFTYYMEGDLGQGFGYKDETLFENSLEAICYIPEYGFIDYCSDIKEAIHDFENGILEKDELPHHINEAARWNGYTKDNFLQLTKNETDAKDLFYSVDWQHPTTLWEEWQCDKEKGSI